MTLIKLRQLYRIGELKRANIITNQDGDGFLLEVDLASGTKALMLKTRTEPGGKHALRVFSSIDAAWQSALEIGFRTALIMAAEQKIQEAEFNLT